VATVALALLAAGCSGSRDANSTFVPAGTTLPGDGDAGATSATATPGGSAKASRTDPLAQRAYQVDPEPRTAAQKAAVKALQGYLDGLVTALASNDVQGSGIRAYTSKDMYADAQSIVAGQAKDGYVLYGAYVFTMEPKGASAKVAVVGVCVDQHGTRRHDARTDAAGKANNTPYVQVDYTLNHLDIGGWVVTGYKGDNMASCPG
jgi:hypothetical protein